MMLWGGMVRLRENSRSSSRKGQTSRSIRRWRLEERDRMIECSDRQTPILYSIYIKNNNTNRKLVSPVCRPHIYSLDGSLQSYLILKQSQKVEQLSKLSGSGPPPGPFKHFSMSSRISCFHCSVGSTLAVVSYMEQTVWMCHSLYLLPEFLIFLI